jgi:hypothetical protein
VHDETYDLTGKVQYTKTFLKARNFQQNAQGVLLLQLVSMKNLLKDSYSSHPS